MERKSWGRPGDAVEPRWGPNLPTQSIENMTEFPQPLEEMWIEIQSLRQQVGKRAPTMKKESLFSQEILKEVVTLNFRQPNLGEYEGSTDPKEHLGRFENTALLHQYSNEAKCRVFVNKLVKSAQQWFNTLKPSSIKSFDDISVSFLHQFASSKRYKKSYLSLFVMRQQEQESLKEFIRRFNMAVLEVPTATTNVMVSVFTQGLQGRELLKSLVKKVVPSYDELLARAEKYVNLEEAQKQMKIEQKTLGIEEEMNDK